MSSTVKQIIVVALIVVVVIVVVIIGIRTLGRIAKSISTNSPATKTNQTATTTDEDSIVKLNTVEPKALYSGKVTFSATVDEVLGVRTFVITSNDLFNKKMLIITEDGIAPIGAKTVDEYLIKKGDKLLITGSLEELTATTPNRTKLNIKTDNLTEWMNKPVIIASKLDRIK